VSLKEEKKEHARTRAQLAEVQDKLELALGEVDILRKQIRREKAQFEQTLVAKDYILALVHLFVASWFVCLQVTKKLLINLGKFLEIVGFGLRNNLRYILG